MGGAVEVDGFCVTVGNADDVGILDGIIDEFSAGNDGNEVSTGDGKPIAGLFVGIFVGSLVCKDEGAFVGFFEGAFVGFFEGAFVGPSEGDFVGKFVGPFVGEGVGNFEGECVGVTVGA